MADFSAPVSDYMSTPVLTIGVLTPLRSVAELMRENDVSSLAVVSADATLDGIVTYTDLLRVGTHHADGGSLLSFPESATVSDAMSLDVAAVDGSMSCAEAAAIMVKKRYHRLVVNRGGDLVGVLSPFDLMRLIVDQGVETPISTYMSKPLITISVEEPISVATQKLEQSRVSTLIVVEGEWLVGLFTQREALQSRRFDKETSVESVMTPAFVALETGTPIHRAAANALTLGARRVVAMSQGRPEGILSGLDMARAVAA